jgi:membrane protein DedA with SNARE-associated domain
MDWAFGWLAEYSYACVLAAAAVDATALPFPGRLVLLAAGVLAAARRVDLGGALVAGMAGAMIGDHLWYFGGRLARGRLQTLYRWVAGRQGQAAVEATDYLRRYGGGVVVIGRFVATVRVLVWPFAGARGIGYGRFLAWDLVAATLWAGAFVGGGYLFGRPALAAMERYGGLALGAAGVGLAAVGGAGFLWLRRRGRRRGPRAGAPPRSRRRG